MTSSKAESSGSEASAWMAETEVHYEKLIPLKLSNVTFLILFFEKLFKIVLNDLIPIAGILS